jgi:hypothetical protein
LLQFNFVYICSFLMYAVFACYMLFVVGKNLVVVDIIIVYLNCLHSRYYSKFYIFSFFAVGFLCKNCPFSRCASVANTVCEDTDIWLKLIIF